MSGKESEKKNRLFLAESLAHHHQQPEVSAMLMHSTYYVLDIMADKVMKVSSSAVMESELAIGKKVG